MQDAKLQLRGCTEIGSLTLRTPGNSKAADPHFGNQWLRAPWLPPFLIIHLPEQWFTTVPFRPLR